MKSKLVLLLFIPFIHSCIGTLPDEELTMIRTPYIGKEIRLDGYYSGISYQSGKTTYISYKFFYSNGVLFTSAGYNSNIQDIDSIIKLMNKDRKDKREWAVFQVKKDSIVMQGWRLRDDVYQNLLTSFQFKIINDTTLSSGTRIYHFKIFSQKPDSMNLFIK